MLTSLTSASADEPTGYSRPRSVERVSVRQDGSEAGFMDRLDPTKVVGTYRSASAMSDSGRYVAFTSRFVDFGLRDTNESTDVYIKDTKSGRLDIVSVGQDGTAGQGPCLIRDAEGNIKEKMAEASYDPILSANGRYVVFTSCAVNLVPGDTNLAPDVFIRDVKHQKTTRVSVDREGNDPDGPSGSPPGSSISIGVSMTPDAKFVGFTSSASDLVEGDTNCETDVFLAEMGTGKIERVNLSDGEEQSTSSCLVPVGPVNLTLSGGTARGVALSADARFVAFSSRATNLVPNDSNKGFDVFVRDRTKETTVLASPPLEDSPPDPQGIALGRESIITTATGQAISSDGRFVVFKSASPSLVPNDTNDAPDVFVYDMERNRVERVSVDSTASIEIQNDDLYDVASISGNGRFVVWESVTSNFIKRDGYVNAARSSVNIDEDIFLFDRRSGAQDWVSRPLGSDDFYPRDQGPDDVSGDPPRISVWPSLNSDGQLVSFYSDLENIVEGDSNSSGDIFIADFGKLVGTGDANTRSSEDRSLSDAGYASVRDHIGDVGIAARPGADITEVEVAWRPGLEDFFWSIDLDRMSSGHKGGGLDPSLLYGISFFVEDIRYEIRAQAVPGVDEPGYSRFGLFRCGEGLLCEEISRLQGGIGTTGRSVSVVMSALALPQSFSIPDARAAAFTAFGSYAGGIAKVLDQASLTEGTGSW